MTSANATTPDVRSLKVPGANLYYEVRGTGPVLIPIPGGPTDAGVFTGLANALSDRYTVVTYDPRGHSRSTLKGEQPDDIIRAHADDVAHLIDAVGGGPANVFGNSGGGTIGLALVARHSAKVKTFVAHEPPLMQLLPDKEHWREIFKKIDEAYRGPGGAFAGMGVFGKAVEEGGPSYSEQQAQQPQGAPDPEQAAMMGRMMANFDFFLAHEIQPIGSFVPDIAALKKAKTRIVVAGGKTSGQQGARRAAAALADELGVDLVLFEGAHGGFGAPEEAFAKSLDAALRG